MDPQTPTPPSPDLRDPSLLLEKCESLAGGMDQQAAAAQNTSALGGHPHPVFFYQEVARTLRAAAAFIRDLTAPPASKPGEEDKSAGKARKQPVQS